MSTSREPRTALPIAPRPELLASLTEANVLAELRRFGRPASRAEIAHAASLSKPAVSAAVARLGARGVLKEVGIREGRRGGVATLYRIDPEHGRSFAVVIQNDEVVVQSRDLDGAVQAERRSRVERDSDPTRIVQQTNELIRSASREHTAPVLAATISIADPVDAHTRVPARLDRSVFPGALIDPGKDLALPAGVALVIDNDVNWAALGEFRQGNLRGCKNFLYVHVGEGIGAGLILDGRLFRGSRGLAGEIGYLRVDGTLDITQLLAGLGLGTSGRYGLDPAKYSALSAGAKKTAIEALAVVVANAVMVVNPEAVALGGPLSGAPGFAEGLDKAVGKLSIDPPRFVRGSATPLLGAALEAHRLALLAIGVPADVLDSMPELPHTTEGVFA